MVDWVFVCSQNSVELCSLAVFWRHRTTYTDQGEECQGTFQVHFCPKRGNIDIHTCKHSGSLGCHLLAEKFFIFQKNGQLIGWRSFLLGVGKSWISHWNVSTHSKILKKILFSIGHVWAFKHSYNYSEYCNDYSTWELRDLGSNHIQFT